MTHALEHVEANVYELGQSPGGWARVAVLLEAADAEELGTRYEDLGCEVKVEEVRTASPTGDDDVGWVVLARK